MRIRAALAAFAAALLVPSAWSQIVERAPAAPSSLPSITALAAAPLAAAAVAAAPLAAPAAGLPAPLPPPQGAAAVLRAAAAGIEQGRFDAVAADFDGNAAANKAETDARYVVIKGRRYDLVPGSNDTARDARGRLYRFGVQGKRLTATPMSSSPAGRTSLPEELLKKLVAKVAAALMAVDEGYVDALTPEQWHGLVDKGLDAMIASLHEPHTFYYDKASWAKLQQYEHGEATDVGLVLDLARERAAFDRAAADVSKAPQDAAKIVSFVHEDGLRVDGTRKDSPAEKAGFRLGDVIVRIGADPIGGRPLDEVMEKFAGEPGTEFRATVSRDGRDLEVVATRAASKFPVLHARLVAPEIGYVYYSSFLPDSNKDFIKALKGLQDAGAKKIIIDLRGNGGGSKAAATGILASLLPRGLQTSYVMSRGKIRSRTRTRRDGPFSGMEKIVLVDGASASASEMTAATLQDYGVTVVGPGKSYGKFSYQLVFPLPPRADPKTAEAGMRLTSGRYYSGKGRSFPGQYDPRTDDNVPGSGGVTPDVIVPMTEEQQADAAAAIQERLYGGDSKPAADPVLDKAVEILSGRR